MNLLKFLAAVCLCPLFSFSLQAQDQICMNGDVRHGKVTDLTLTSVRYLPVGQSTLPVELPLSKVLILINADGGYLVPAQLDLTDDHSKDLLSRFFSKDNSNRKKDQIFTLQHAVMEVNISNEDDQFIYWEDTAKINKHDLAAIIYNNGHTKFFTEIDQAAGSLGACQESSLNLGLSTPIAATPTSLATTTSATSEVTPASAATPNTSATTTPAPSRSDASTGKDNTAARAIVEKLLLKDNIAPKEFEDKCTEKTKEFSDYLGILCDKQALPEKVKKATNQAIGLFVSEESTVEVASNNRNGVNSWKIRTYLNRLKMVDYDRISVRWTHVQYIGDIKQGADGNLYGTVSFQQEFKGYRDNRLVYSDVTIKTANIMLKTYVKTIEGSTVKKWDIMLSDVGVDEIKSI